MWLAGLATGFFLFAGYAFQTIGLQYTTSSKAGFITGLSVVIVPVLSATLLRRVPENRVLMGVVLSTIGLALLLLPESAGLLLRPGSAGLVTLGANLMPSRGDLIVLCCAVCFALHIVAVSRFAPRTDALALTIVQVAAVAVFSAISATLAGEWQQPPLPPVIGAAVFTGVLATALAFAVQNSVQVWTTATHTALIFASEPVFAGIFGYWLGGERLAGWGLVGSALILTGMLVAELRALPTWRTNPLGGDTT
jgi:drug/metabolite transporter (DMT)-like permease